MAVGDVAVSSPVRLGAPSGVATSPHSTSPHLTSGVATSFGFDHPPKVTLMLKAAGAKSSRDQKGKKGSKSGHGFSADNPYGQKKTGDKRQFAH